MPHISGIRRVFRLATRRARVDDDIDDELAFHFERTIDDLVARGMSRDDAREHARRRFGDVDARRAELRAIDQGRDRTRRFGETVQSLAHDVRMAARVLRRAPGLTAVIVLTLGLGVGANSMMFGVVDRMLLRPPRYIADAARTERAFFAHAANGADDAIDDRVSWPTYSVDVWVPLTAASAVDASPDFAERYDMALNTIVTRRHAGVSESLALARLTAAYRASEARRRRGDAAEEMRARVALYPAIGQRGPRPSDNVRVTLWATGVAVAVLLVACANVVNLLLVRAVQRERETAVRLALGVTGARLVKQLAIEAALIASLGAIAALAFAWLGRLLVSRVLLPDAGWGSATNSIWRSAPVDARSLGVNGAVALVAALVASLAPALYVMRADVVARLRGGAREGSGARHARLRAALVLVQAALSVVLLVGAGLFVRSLRNARDVRLGVDASRVAYAWVELRSVRLDKVAKAALYARLAETARAMPFVDAAGTALCGHVGFTARGVRLANGDTLGAALDIRDNVVGGDYFRVMGTRVLRGRAFDARMPSRDASTIVVSARLAQMLWPGADPLGKCLAVAMSPECRTVIGVVEDVRNDPRDRPGAAIYRPAAPSEGDGVGSIVVRTRGEARTLENVIRRALEPVLPASSFLVVRPLADDVDPPLRSWRIGATLFLTFGAMGLFVAAIGLYSALAYDVAQRRREMGVRLALGALRGDVLRLVVRRGLAITAGGLATGIALVLVGGRAASTLLFGVAPHDAVTIGAVTLTLGAVALAASVVPGLRAARVSPSEALRSE